MLSVSSDLALKVWDCNTGACLRSFSRHADYVKARTLYRSLLFADAAEKALAVSSAANLVATAGLDRSVYVWDLERLVSASETMPEPLCTRPNRLMIFCLTMLSSCAFECAQDVNLQRGD